ncbi:MAG: PDZ domain-containing protein [bacterium]|nr:PDZ domain-containing protein [bacterium]
MKKTGVVAGVGFLAGALFLALFLGYFRETPPGEPANGSASNLASTSPITTPEINIPADTGSDTAPGNSAGDTNGIDTGSRENLIEVDGSRLSFAPLVKKVRPAVVKVTSVPKKGSREELLKEFFNSRPRRERNRGVGSGFLVSGDGYIVTNHHVVKGAHTIKITTLDETEYPARIIGADPRTDLALLKIDAENMPFVRLGDSNKVEIGEWVLAIGNPLNQDQTVTAGIISAKGRQLGAADFEDFLQTDAAINLGNSGGPLINMEGRVIGINSSILATFGGNIGIGFAIPSNMAGKVIRDLKSKGRVIRGYMGINIRFMGEQDIKDWDLPTTGVIITDVEENSPAEIAGLEKIDLIVEINGKTIKNTRELAGEISESRPGDILELTIYRKKEKKTIAVKVGEAPETLKYVSPGEDGQSFDLGMVLMKNTPALTRMYNLKTPNGLLVTQVKKDGIADKSIIKRLDVILEVNGKELDGIEQLQGILSKKKPGSLIMLTINRAGNESFLRFKLPE